MTVACVADVLNLLYRTIFTNAWAGCNAGYYDCCNYLFHAGSGPCRFIIFQIIVLWRYLSDFELSTSDCQGFLNQSRMCLYNRFTTFCQRWLNLNKSRV